MEIQTNEAPPPPPTTTTTTTTWRLFSWFPLFLSNYYWTECVWPGLGLFGESYLLFSIGTLTPIWELLFPDCFVTFETCRPSLTKSFTYTVVLGVMCGMMLLGTLANTLGRRTGSIVTASCMCAGAWGMTLCSFFVSKGSNQASLFQCLVTLLFVFGVGVGGEYPLSASSASERAMEDLRKQQLQQQEEDNSNNMVEFDYAQVEDEQQYMESTPPPQQQIKHHHHCHRGRRVQLVFTMQGMGIMFNCILMTLLLFIMGQNGENGDTFAQEGGSSSSVSGQYTASSLLAIWRITYAIGASVLTYVWASRMLYLQESQVWLQDLQQRQDNKNMASNNHNNDNNHANDGSDELQQQQQQQQRQQDYQQQQQQQQQQQDYYQQQQPHNERNSDTPSLDSNVSSLSAPSVSMKEEQSIQQVPSTTSVEDLRSTEMTLLWRNYGGRLFGACATWFLWDIAFYGNKLFQASFLLALTGENTTLLEMSGAATLNAFVALLGYYSAALLMDEIGRVRLQQYGLFATGILFCGCGLFYDKLPTNWLVAMYFGSSFFGQCGPNATTFVIPAEIFPTEMRTMCHGIAAASGKAGALLAAIVFSRVETTTNLFLWSGYASFTAAVITFCTIPETTDLNLYETDRRWRMILEGRKADYVGEATMPKYLSFYEQQTMASSSCHAFCHNVHDI